MNYTDEQLLAFYKYNMTKYIQDSILTLNEFKSFLNTKPKAIFKAKAKKYFEDGEIESDDSIVKHQDKKLKDQDAVIKIDNL